MKCCQFTILITGLNVSLFSLQDFLYIIGIAPICKKQLPSNSTTIQCSSIRETDGSRHHRTQFRTHSKPLEHQSSMVQRGLRGPSNLNLALNLKAKTLVGHAMFCFAALGATLKSFACDRQTLPFIFLGSSLGPPGTSPSVSVAIAPPVRDFALGINPKQLAH